MDRFFILSLVLLFGCSKGFDRVELRERLDRKIKVTDADLQRALSLRPLTNFPMKVGVILITDYVRREGMGCRCDWARGYGRWVWTPQEEELVSSWAGTLKAQGLVSEFFLISGWDRNVRWNRIRSWPVSPPRAVAPMRSF